MVAKRIEAIDTNPEKPWASTAKFADGTSFYGPTEHIQQAYEQQRQAERLSMLASNAPYAGGGGAPAFSAPSGGGAPAAQAQPDVQAINVAHQPSAVMSEVPDTGAYSPSDIGQGLARAGVTHADLQTARAMQAIDPRVTPLDVLANKKTQSFAGTPEISKRTAESMIAMPSARSTTVEGAKPVDEERWNHVQNLTRQAVDAQAQAQIAEGTAATDTARAQALAAQQLHDQMAQQQASDEANFRSRYNNMLGEVDQAGKRQVDPQRWFSQHGAVGSMMAILGSAMIQAANLRNGGSAGPNMLQQFIEQDINAQSRDLERQGHQANNMLASLSQQWGSVEAGKAALRSSQLRLADSQLAEIAANGRNKAMQQQALALRAQTEKQIAQADYDLHAAAQGTRRETEQDQMMLPRAATRGGTRTTYNFGGIAGQVGERAKTEYAQAKDAQANAQDVAKETEHIQPALEALDEAAQARGFVKDAKTGEYVLPAGKDDLLHGIVDKTALGLGHVPLIGAGLRGINATGQKERELAAQKHDEAALLVRRAMYTRAAGGQGGEEGGGLSADAISEALHGRNGSSGAEAMNGMRRALITRQASYKSGAGEAATNKFESGLHHEESKVSQADRKQGSLTAGFEKSGMKVAH